jgi:hypothetical protein
METMIHSIFLGPHKIEHYVNLALKLSIWNNLFHLQIFLWDIDILCNHQDHLNKI